MGNRENKWSRRLDRQSPEKETDIIVGASHQKVKKLDSEHAG